MKHHRRFVVILLAGLPLLLQCRYSAKPASGVQSCAPGPKPCPTGYYCAADQQCWAVGTQPTTKNASGAALVPAGVHARSSRFVTTSGGALETGGTAVQRSSRYRFVGGLVGASATGDGR